MGDWCMRHHTESGLVQQVLRSSNSMSDAENKIIDFLKQVTNANVRLVLAGNSVYVDQLFLKKDMPRLNNLLDQFILDCSVFKELILRFNPSISNETPLKFGQLHRALDDIRNSIEEFRYYKTKALQRKTVASQKSFPVNRNIHQDLLWIEVSPNFHCILTDGNLNIIDEMNDTADPSAVIHFLRQNRIRYKRMIPMAGRRLGSLRGFLQETAPELNEYCHYRSIDIDVVSLVCQAYFPEVYQARPYQLEELSLYQSIDLLRYYRNNIFR